MKKTFLIGLATLLIIAAAFHCSETTFFMIVVAVISAYKILTAESKYGSAAWLAAGIVGISCFLGWVNIFLKIALVVTAFAIAKKYGEDTLSD